jgi:hypothetical protein
MDDPNTRRLRFDVEPKELVRLLQRHSKAKAGPFSWRMPSGEGEIALYLEVRRSSLDGFECRVNTIHYRKPGGSFFAHDGIHAITLHGSKLRDGETLVLLKCEKPRSARPIFLHFFDGMEKLREELAISVASREQEQTNPTVKYQVPPEGEGKATQSASSVEERGPGIDRDTTLDALDRSIITAVDQLHCAGLRPTDELVASRLPPNPRTDLSYHRVTVNKRRCRLRDKGYDV